MRLPGPLGVLEVTGLTGSGTGDTLLDVVCSLDGAACQVCKLYTNKLQTLHLEPETNLKLNTLNLKRTSNSTH